MRNFSIEFKWAAIATLAALVWMFVVKSLGFHSVEKIRFEVLLEILFNFILILFYWLGIRQKKKEFYNGIITWQKAFLSGLVMCILITFFYPMIQYITFNQVTPEFMDTLTQAIVTQTNIPLEEAQKNATFDIFLRNGVTNNLSFGVVIIAVVSYFQQTKDKELLKKNATQKAEVVKVKKNKTKRKTY
ncbi:MULTISPECIES: DUF4199 domain-containing protein [Myroides]|uniref:DUF4199 family protein n=1 Tax=Myroides albus TaxID=2562892 RepID=A0A6I3LQ97_9FLAO|nr:MULTISPECIES: DUF4199 domain-containing protein [Myroides]MTG98302.1 DUF4199 family protein [Myroides albus]MVX36848.1 DUF4199 family protein [Myroides sp. LoEW2-1]UVD79626.1 DUF4199 domain-containing protein [Myroides albus]